MSEMARSYGSTASWPEKLRAAAAWFDLVDRLIASIEVTVTATGETYPLLDKIRAGRQIQDDLLALAALLEDGDAPVVAP